MVDLNAYDLEALTNTITLVSTVAWSAQWGQVYHFLLTFLADLDILIPCLWVFHVAPFVCSVLCTGAKWLPLRSLPFCWFSKIDVLSCSVHPQLPVAPVEPS